MRKLLSAMLGYLKRFAGKDERFFTSYQDEAFVNENDDYLVICKWCEYNEEFQPLIHRLVCDVSCRIHAFRPRGLTCISEKTFKEPQFREKFPVLEEIEIPEDYPIQNLISEP